jgi:succinoglycan biosynthesis transport protein ExoP
LQTPNVGKAAGEPQSILPGASTDFLRLLSRGKFTIIGCLLLGALLGYLYFLTRPAAYRSDARVMVINQTANMAANSAEAYRDDWGEANGLTARLAAHAMLLQSTKIADDAVKTSELANLPTLAGHGSPAAKIVAGMKAKRLSTDRSNEVTNVLQVSYGGEDPEECKKILEAVLRAYEDYLQNDDHSTNAKVKQIIGEMKDSLMKDLRATDEQLDKLQKGLADASFGPAELLSSEEELRKLEAIRNNYEFERQQAHEQLNAIPRLRDKGLNDYDIWRTLTDSRLRPAANGEGKAADKPGAAMTLAGLYGEVAELRARGYADNHREVRALNQRIAEVRKQLGVQGRDLGNNNPLKEYEAFLRGQVELFSRLARGHDQTYNRLTANAGRARNHRLQEDMLRQRRAYQQQMVEAFANKLTGLDLTRNFGGLEAVVIDQPSFGIQTEPNFNRIMLVALFLGAGAGLLAAYLMELTDKSFKSPEEIKAQLGAGVLGHVPIINANDGKDAGRPAPGKESWPAPDKSLVAYHRPRSRVAEAYRAVRTGLYFGASGRGQSIIQITSPHPGDGKSTLSTNLSVSIAQSGKRVLLVDADLRRPRVHKLFHLSSKTGMTSVINETATIDDAIHETIVEGLWVMPCGPRPDNPAELLTSPKFKDLLEELRKRFDFVIVDTPPLLAVTDPCAVAPRVDGVILTLRVGPRTRSSAIRATEMLEAIGANVFGVVVNGVGQLSAEGVYTYDANAYGSRYYRYGEEYYIAGDRGGPNYGFDDAPRSRRAKTSVNGNGHAAVATLGGDGDPERGDDGLDDPAQGTEETALDMDAVAPPDPLIERSDAEPPPLTPTKLQDLLKKHQAKKPPEEKQG